MSKSLPDSNETECPCKEGVTEAECEDCQDLPRGTLAYWRSLKKAQSNNNKESRKSRDRLL